MRISVSNIFGMIIITLNIIGFLNGYRLDPYPPGTMIEMIRYKHIQIC